MGSSYSKGGDENKVRFRVNKALFKKVVDARMLTGADLNQACVQLDKVLVYTCSQRPKSP